MINVTTVEDIYPAMDELVTRLKASGQVQMANILHHRMHKVAWTARSELFEELKNVLGHAIESNEERMHEPERGQIKQIIFIISEHLNSERQAGGG